MIATLIRRLCVPIALAWLALGLLPTADALGALYHELLVKYWGPGKRYPQRCPVRYSIQAVKSACSNAVRRQRREGGGDG